MFTGSNPRSPTPLAVQIAESVRRAIETGQVAPGDLLPSVRSLATRLRVNPTTVTHAYRELVRDGLAIADGEGSQQVLRIARPGSGTPRPKTLSESARQRANASEPSRLEPGELLEERFKIKRLLGAGAMGAVSLARDLELDEDVALKILPPLAGSGTKRDGKVEATESRAGIVAQKLLIHAERPPAKRAQDVLYLHDTIQMFGPALAELNELWRTQISVLLTNNQRRRVRDMRRRLFASVTPTIRDSASIPVDRALRPEDMRVVCEPGLHALLADD